MRFSIEECLNISQCPERRVAALFFCTTIFQFMHAFFLISRRLSRREEEYLRQDCQNHRNATNQKLEIYIPISITKYGMQSRVSSYAKWPTELWVRRMPWKCWQNRFFNRFSFFLNFFLAFLMAARQTFSYTFLGRSARPAIPTVWLTG